MHIEIKDPISGELIAVICVSRTTKTCNILQCNIDMMEQIVAIAAGMKVGEITLQATIAETKELENYGWRESEDKVLMVRKVK